jgi:hypothetical protein
MKIAVSTNADKDRRTNWAWGDYWARYHLEKAFQALGYETTRDWEGGCDLLVELWGDPIGIVKNYKHKTCWYYSHPENMVPQVAKEYDWIFCLSKPWLSIFTEWGFKNVTFLPSCGHSTLPEDRSIIYDVVYLANAKVRGSTYGRYILNDLEPAEIGIKLDVYGLRWEDYPAMKPFHRGRSWNNLELNKLYGRAKISLADCHEPMRDGGFIPIRVYDILLSGGFCISNQVVGIEEVFEDAVVTYSNKRDLQEKVLYYLSHEKERQKKVKKGLKLVQGHTYLERAKTIIEVCKKNGWC